MKTANGQIKKHYGSCYRYSRNDNQVCFGQVKKSGREWHAEIRRRLTGDLYQYAGIWDSRKDAVEEMDRILEKDCRI